MAAKANSIESDIRANISKHVGRQNGSAIERARFALALLASSRASRRVRCGISRYSASGTARGLAEHGCCRESFAFAARICASMNIALLCAHHTIFSRAFAASTRIAHGIKTAFCMAKISEKASSAKIIVAIWRGRRQAVAAKRARRQWRHRRRRRK